MAWVQSHINDIKSHKLLSILLVVLIVYLIYILIVVWNPKLLNLKNEPYGYDPAYWAGVKLGTSFMSIIVLYHILFDMTHMMPMK